MPWKEVSMVDQRREFVSLALTGEVAIAELCRRFGISRDSGHRLLRRHAELGDGALMPGSRRPHGSPTRTDAAMEQQVLDLRDRHPSWGGRKLARRLRDMGLAEVPAPSTITAILRRHGRIDPDRAVHHRPWQRFERAAPNELWQMDFKGHIALQQGRCHPLTVIDDHCRFALGLRACADEQATTVRGQLAALFVRYGLPEAILCDNGSPWGATGHQDAQGRRAFTATEVWLLRLGIATRHGRPYHPQTQGKDERFHRTLNTEVLQMRQPMADLTTAQAVFDEWREIYNHQRPHEALGLATPASRYRLSPRTFPQTLPEPQYDTTDLTRRVRPDGAIRFAGHSFAISRAFAAMTVALRPTAIDGLWDVFFSRFAIAQIDLRDGHA